MECVCTYVGRCQSGTAGAAAPDAAAGSPSAGAVRGAPIPARQHWHRHGCGAAGAQPRVRGATTCQQHALR